MGNFSSISIIIVSFFHFQNALVSNPRYGRARSTDRDVWLEHTDRSVVIKSQTVFQPVMKKKRSVNKLSTAADVKGVTNYCLYTQEADSDGDIQTKLYKVSAHIYFKHLNFKIVSDFWVKVLLHDNNGVM